MDEIGFLTLRISTDDLEIGAGGDPLMAGSRRQDDDVAGFQPERLAGLAAEAHARRAG
jgi:hypothetical protein